MTNPCPGYPITTPYWKQGSWSCGYHDGVDYAAPGGVDVVSTWGGTVVEAAYPTTYGSAFGRAVVIDHDKLPDGSAGGWGLYAHLSSECVSVGQRVEMSTRLGAVGTTGNSTGNHLHFAVYMTPYWSSCGGVNPSRWINAGTSATSGGCTSSYPAPTDNLVLLSKLRQGTCDSDSVWHLQNVLNKHTLAAPGDVTLPLTGCMLDQTSTVVLACQQQHGYGNDPMGSVFVGEAQAAHLFDSSYDVRDDT